MSDAHKHEWSLYLKSSSNEYGTDAHTHTHTKHQFRSIDLPSSISVAVCWAEILYFDHAHKKRHTERHRDIFTAFCILQTWAVLHISSVSIHIMHTRIFYMRLALFEYCDFHFTISICIYFANLLWVVCIERKKRFDKHLNELEWMTIAIHKKALRPALKIDGDKYQWNINSIKDDRLSH